VCLSIASALSPGAGASSSSSSSSTRSKKKKGILDYDRLDDLDLDELELELEMEMDRDYLESTCDPRIEDSWFARMIAQQHAQNALNSVHRMHGGGLHELLCCAFGTADRSSGIAQAALLAPAPVELWVSPAQWCAKRAALAQEHMCSECETAPLQVLWPLLAPNGWKSKSEVRSQG
jgi:hypothetical protein